ncbi:hypothetical protein Dimus_033046 [Dionaea muscipula]
MIANKMLGDNYHSCSSSVLCLASASRPLSLLLAAYSWEDITFQNDLGRLTSSELHVGLPMPGSLQP